MEEYKSGDGAAVSNPALSLEEPIRTLTVEWQLVKMPPGMAKRAFMGNSAEARH